MHDARGMPLGPMKVEVFETTISGVTKALQQLLARKGATEDRIEIHSIHTAGAASEGHSYHWVTVVYREVRQYVE